MEARPQLFLNYWLRPLPGWPSFQLAHVTVMVIRAWTCYSGYRPRAFTLSGPIWTERSVFIWMEQALRLICRIFTDLDLGGFIAPWGPSIALNHVAGLLGIFLSHQDNGTAYTGENFLLRVERRNVRFNTLRFEQATYNQSFRFLLSIKHSNQLFIR